MMRGKRRKKSSEHFPFELFKLSPIIGVRELRTHSCAEDKKFEKKMNTLNKNRNSKAAKIKERNEHEAKQENLM